MLPRVRTMDLKGLPSASERTGLHSNSEPYQLRAFEQMARGEAVSSSVEWEDGVSMFVKLSAQSRCSGTTGSNG